MRESADGPSTTMVGASHRSAGAASARAGLVRPRSELPQDFALKLGDKGRVLTAHSASALTFVTGPKDEGVDCRLIVAAQGTEVTVLSDGILDLSSETFKAREDMMFRHDRSSRHGLP